jgi:hypothetical protein
MDNKLLRSDIFKEAVVVNTKRVYDACRDRDCLDDLRVYFIEEDQEVIKNALGVRLKCSEVLNVYIDTEPVNYNRGYYTVDLTIYFAVDVEATVSPCGLGKVLHGLSVYNKKAILYGSEGSVRTFSSDYVGHDDDIQNLPSSNLPIVTCQIADPVNLGAKLTWLHEHDHHKHDCGCHSVPLHISRRFGGELHHGKCERIVEVTLGIFMIISLEREVQMLIPVYDFSLPDKVCVEESSDNPCDLFSRIGFPTDAFFPRASGGELDCGCGKF